MSTDIVDLEEIALNWARGFPTEDEVEEIEANDLDFSKLRITHEPTEYVQQTQAPDPKSHVISTCYFTNSTSQPQVFNLKSERRTKSVCKISMAKTYTIGYSVDIRMRPPNPVIEANAGFKGDLSITNANETTIEETIVWSVDSKVKVPPKTCTKAELMLTESEYSSDFKSVAKFEGVVAMTLRPKKKSIAQINLGVPAREIFYPDQRFRIEGTRVYFLSKGSCKCRFGTEQFVKLSQSSTEEELTD